MAVLTLDFLTPIVDDPYDFGRVAAANALSDVFAMGAKPLCALNVLALDCSLGTEVAGDILRGGADAVSEAGAIVAGGHSIDDKEPKYGLVVFGTARPDEIRTNGGAQTGDALYLTKALGTGIMSSARKNDVIDDAAFREAIDSMEELNKAGAEAAAACDGVHALTDVTGFGLAGHLHEMLDASGRAAEISYEALPTFGPVKELSAQHRRPGRTASIIDFAAPFVEQGDLDDTDFDDRMGVVCDPQTSGGLLIALDPAEADTFEEAFEQAAGRAPARIGTIAAGPAGTIRFSD